MRKSFPVPKGLGSPSFAGRYAENRKNTSPRTASKKGSLKRFLPSEKKLDLTGTSLKTSRAGLGLLAGIFGISFLFWIILLIYG